MIRKSTIPFLLGLFLVISCVSFKAFSQTDFSNNSSVQLKNRTINLSQDLDSLAAFTQKSSGQNPVLAFIQFSQTAAVQKARQASAIKKESYVGENTFLCSVQGKLAPVDFKNSGVNAWSAVSYQDKLSPALKTTHGGSPIAVLVQLSKSYDQAALATLVQNTKAQMEIGQPWKRQNIIQLSLPDSEVIQWAKSAFVLYIQPKFNPSKLSNSQAVGYTNAEKAHQPTSIGGYNLLGDGMTVGVGDDANPIHIDYIDRVTSFNPSAGNEHGNHTTGTVGGNGIVDQRYRGFAPHVHLIEDYFEQIISNAPNYYNNFDMIATNNSYAMIVGNCNYAGTYDVYSAYLDQQAADLPHVLNCFAAGNDGALNCTPYTSGYATVAGSYQTAKDVLTVGAIGLTRNTEYYKFSRGPVKDGRIKPEITAMGYKLISTWKNNGYASDNGTSMSTPNVTGGATLLYERYKQLHSSQDAPNALIKLLLMNGADDIAQPGPDYHYGFGLMNLGRSLTMLDSSHYFVDSIQTSQQQTFTFSVPSNTSVAKIMLYWDDPAASPMSTANLVNDLDLSVVSPGNTTTLPLILNPSPSQVSANAVQGVDHTNNVEQVTLNSPSSGTYTIKVNGYDVPQGPQKYYVAYSFIPTGIAFQYPYGSETLMAGDSMYVYWQADSSSSTFTLSYSTDSGSTWQVIASNIVSSSRAYFWHIPSTINSATCLLKLTRGSETATNHAFTITGRPVITIAATATQCPGSVNFSWPAISGISSYQIFKKSGIDMQPVATTTGTSYTITGLSPDSTYWIAVSAIVGGKAGIRSVAKSYQPNQGNCSLVATHGDLRMSSIVSPVSGRVLTSSALTSTNSFQVKIQNLDNQNATNFKISWTLNNSAWQDQTFNSQTVGAAGFTTLTLPSLNLADTGKYTLKVAVTNLAITDPTTGNDTLSTTFRQIPNDAVSLTQPYIDGFESFPEITEVGDTVMGVGNSNHWDFAASQANGRIRSFVNSGLTIQGNRSISLDNKINQAANIQGSSQNTFTGTFNLSNYDTSTDEVRTTFYYFMSGVPKFDSGNQVWIRGNESDPWIPLYTYQIDPNNLGILYSSGSVSLSDALETNGQNFSSSTQIRFGQRDTSQIESSYYGNGLTMDYFSLYKVQNDVQLLAVDSVFHFNCALSDQVPLHAVVYNSVQNTVYHVPITYKLDNLTPITDTIDSIPGKDTIRFTFPQKMDLSALGNHNLSVWCALPTDNYRLNDSILNYAVYNQPVIDSFPYLQNFEANDGYFYTNGTNDSWQYGTPNSPAIKKAASGTKAWKTNLTGDYNDNESSYLYSPCYDISSLSNPTLSFSLADDIENNPSATTVYDQAYVEYTTDGLNWQKLGAAGQGYNWYNNANANAWTKEGETWWHVATIPLPHIAGNIAFRFVLKSDAGGDYEGLAIDDIHIYDLQKPIYTGDSLSAPVFHTIAANDTADYMNNSQILATIINSGSNTLNGTTVNRYSHTNFVNADSSQYFLPESFVIKSTNSPSDSVELHLYVLAAAMKAVREADVCPSCSTSNEIYRMGVSQYTDNDTNKVNSNIFDNNSGQWTYIPWQDITYVPYDSGYEAIFKVSKFSEIWFNSGGPDNNAPLNINLFRFNVSHADERSVLLQWSSLTDAQTTKYFVQRADSGFTFQTFREINPVRQNDHVYQLLDTPMLYRSYVLYRIMYENDDGKIYYSPIRQINWANENGDITVYPNPVYNGILNLSWFKGNNAPLQWQFFDYTGKLIRTGTTSGNAFNDIQEIPVGKWGLASGVYLLKVITPKKNWTFKIVYKP